MSNHPSAAWSAARVALGVLFWEGTISDLETILCEEITGDEREGKDV